MVASAEPAPPRPVAAVRSASRSPWWATALAAVALLVLVTIAVTALLPAQLLADKTVERDGEASSVGTPYAIVPAAAEPVADRVSYADLGDDVVVDLDLDGRVYFVTVRQPAQSLLSWWVAADREEIEFLTQEERFGPQTPAQERTVNLQRMRTSSQVAQYVALTLAGYQPELVPGQVQIEQLLCLDVDGARCIDFVPSDEQLDPGDLIVAVDGAVVATVDDLEAALDDDAPGDVVPITVDRGDDGEVDVEVELIESPDEPGRAIIGFLPFDTASVRLPFEIVFDTDEIGGPSAGLAFTLTLLDELTEGDLLGGVNVAVTGTIELDGTVGPIGGLPQKVSTVRQAGIDHFLVPAGQSEGDMERAREIAGDDVELIVVADVDEALAALERLGGDPLVE